MTNKQLQVLKLFAVGYPLHMIAKREQVSLSTVQNKLKAINNTNEFDNACGIRNCYKRAKKNIRNPQQLNQVSTVICKY